MENSPTRLNRQLSQVFGVAEITIHSSTLDLLDISSSQLAKCAVAIAGPDNSMIRSSSAIRNKNVVHWNETFEFRCCKGWKVMLNLVVHDDNWIEDAIITTDWTQLTNTGNSTQRLFLDQLCVGEITYSVNFYSNHLSFKGLVIDTALQPDLPVRLIIELLSIIKPVDRPSKTKSLLTKDFRTDASFGLSVQDCNTVHSMLQDLKFYATHPEILSKDLYAFYKKSSNFNGEEPVKQSAATPCDTSIGDELEIEYDEISLPLYKVANIMKSFLTSLVINIPQAPPVTINLVEKLLSIYITTILGSSSDSDLNASLTHLSLNKSFSILNSVAVDESEDGTSSNMQWEQLLTVCIISALWMLQQALTASSLIQENNAQYTGSNTQDWNLLSLPELDGIRFGFNLYDRELSGEMAASDLPLLLQDMGEEYTSEEIELILEDINPDKLPTIEFAEFVRWWCEV